MENLNESQLPLMDCDAIDREHDSHNNSNGRTNNYNPNNYLNAFLSDGENEKRLKIRLLPCDKDSNTPYKVIHTHNIKVNKEVKSSGYKSFICLNDKESPIHDERGCPLCNKARELWKKYEEATTEGEKKYYKDLAKHYSAKETYFVRVIERGKEDEGVKFWRFNRHFDGTDCHDKIEKLYKNRKEESIEEGEAPYSIYNLQDGKDLVLTITKPESGAKGYKYEISDVTKRTPLSESYDQMVAWVYDDKKWSDVYGTKNYDYLEIIGEGEVPVFDREQNKYVAKVVKTEAEKEAEVKAINESLVVKMEDIPHVVEDSELPF